MFKKRLTAVATPGWLGSIAFAVALSGCVPIPISQRVYVPNKADVTKKRGQTSMCAFNEAVSAGVRQIGDVKVETRLVTLNEGTSKAQAQLTMYVHQTSSSGTFSSVSLNASRIKLEENGRTLVARLKDRETHKYAGGKSNWTRFELIFPAPSAVSETLRVVFGANTLGVAGHSVPLAPIRFDLRDSPMVYMFPCIPT